MILEFKNKTQKEKDSLIGKGYFFITECASKNIDIEIKQIKDKKSHEQIKAAYKLFQLCLPHFIEWRPKYNWDLERIKEFLKSELGYTRSPNDFEIAIMIKQSGFTPKNKKEYLEMSEFCKKIKQNVSFADFEKTKFCDFLEEVQVWAQTENKTINKSSWQNVYLEKQQNI